MKGELKVKGSLVIEAFDETGAKVDEIKKDNAIVKSGAAFIAKLLSGQCGSLAQPLGSIHVGSNNTATNIATDIALKAKLSENEILPANTTVSGSVITVSAKFTAITPSTGLNGQILDGSSVNEIGVFHSRYTDTTTGNVVLPTMIDRVVLTAPIVVGGTSVIKSFTAKMIFTIE